VTVERYQWLCEGAADVTCAVCCRVVGARCAPQVRAFACLPDVAVLNRIRGPELQCILGTCVVQQPVYAHVVVVYMYARVVVCMYEPY
jgi:hypothetical protein